MQIWYISPCFLHSLFTHVGPKQFFIPWLRGVIWFLRRYLHLISVYLTWQIRLHACTQNITDETIFHMVGATVSGERPNLLRICLNVHDCCCECLCGFESRAWGNKVMLCGLAAYIVLEHEFGQQEGNSEAFPYREQSFPGGGGQKGREAWALRGWDPAEGPGRRSRTPSWVNKLSFII